VNGNFSSVVVCDFEYEAAPGDLPNVLCMVAYVLDENLQHVRTVRLWRGEFGSAPPFDTGPDTLFVAFGLGGNDVLQGLGLGVSRAQL
jgi:DNA polymerase I